MAMQRQVQANAVPVVDFFGTDLAPLSLVICPFTKLRPF
jgi:hypothetical protein